MVETKIRARNMANDWGDLPSASRGEVRQRSQIKRQGSSAVVQEDSRAVRLWSQKAWESAAAWNSVREIDVVTIGLLAGVGKQKGLNFAPSTPRAAWTASGLDQWPRFLQMASIAALIAAMLFSTADVFSAAVGLCIGFTSMSLLFFANYAAWRNDLPGWFIGPHVAMIGTACSITIAIAIGVNLAI